MKIKKLIFATHNSGKALEVRSILSGLDIGILTAEEVGIFEDVTEDSDTFKGNAFKKAKFITDKTGEWAIADDSGLCIDALSGAPGVHSARWVGEGKSGDEIIAFTLEKMRDVSKGSRGAYFQTSIALVSPTGENWIFEGRINGIIINECQGEAHHKLPYDSIFIPEGRKETFAEMGRDEKSLISPRGQALRKMRDFIENFERVD